MLKKAIDSKAMQNIRGRAHRFSFVVLFFSVIPRYVLGAFVSISRRIKLMEYSNFEQAQSTEEDNESNRQALFHIEHQKFTANL